MIILSRLSVSNILVNKWLVNLKVNNTLCLLTPQLPKDWLVLYELVNLNL